MISRGESLAKAYVYMHLRPHPPPVIPATAKLPQLMQVFHAGHHRGTMAQAPEQHASRPSLTYPPVLVADEKGEAIGVVSQSQVVHFLAAHVNYMDSRTAKVSLLAMTAATRLSKAGLTDVSRCL